MLPSSHSEYLAHLPLTWKRVPLRDLGAVHSGGTPSRRNPLYWDGQIAWVTPSELTNLRTKHITETRDMITQSGLSASSAALLPAGSLVVTTRATIGNVAVAGIPLCTNQGFKNIVLGGEAHEDFYYHLLKFISGELVRLASGTTFLEISAKDFSSVVVPLPPLPEQRRMAEILDTADEAIRQTERVIAKLTAIKDGLLHDLLTRGLDEHGDLRDPEAHPEQFKDSPLGRIPSEWEIARLTCHVSLPTGQVDPRQQPYRDWPLLAPDHVESGTGRVLDVRTAAEQNAISGKYVFERGDVVYSKIRPYLRKAILAEWTGLCSADMYPLRPEPGTLVPRYLLAIVLGEPFSRFAESVSMRSGFPKINREELGEYRMALPSREEQIRIVGVLNAQDARIRAEEAALAKLRQIKSGLMDDLLTGKVRVTSA